MATISIRIDDDLQQKAQSLASEQGVSLERLIAAALAATLAQRETLDFFDERLRGVDRDELHLRVLKFMQESRPGSEPDSKEIQRAVDGN